MDNHTTTAADDVIVAGHHSHSQSSGRTTAHTDTAAAAEKLRALEQTKIKPFLISVTVIAALGGMLFGTWTCVWWGTSVSSLNRGTNSSVEYYYSTVYHDHTHQTISSPAFFALPISSPLI